MFIDAHCHTGSFEPLFRGDHDTDDLIAAWDAAGIGCGIISNVIKGAMTAANDLARKSAEGHPGRIYPCIYLDPSELPTAMRELDRCAETGAFRGVKLHPSEDAWFPYLDHYAPLFKRINQLRLPILMHSGTYPHSGPLACAAAARRCPDVPFILGHFGLADSLWECFPAAELAPNVHADTTLNGTLPPMIEWAEKFGADRLLWGSDFPFGGVEAEKAKIELEFPRRGLSDAECSLIAAGNASRIFSLPGNQA